MNRIAKYLSTHRTLFWSLMVGILLAGIYSFIQMPKLEDPPVVVKQEMVVIPFPGASAHDVELEVAMPMEDVLRTLPDVSKIKSECFDGMAMITVEYNLDVKNEEIEQYFDLLRRKVADNHSTLPRECYDPIILDDMMDVYGLFYAMTGDGYTFSEMERYANYLRRQLLTVKGVKRVNIVGAPAEKIEIILPEDQIATNGMLPTQIMMQLNSSGKVVNAGTLQMGNQRVRLDVSDAVRSEEDIRNLQIKTTTGGTVRLGDIAEVRRVYDEPNKQGFFVDGKSALAIMIALNDDVVVPDVGKAVEEKLAEVMPGVPAGMEMQKVYFQPDKVNDAIGGFMVNLLESVVIVILLLVFTMGVRSGLIIGLGLVLTIALSFPILLSIGTTLQRISLGAFIVAMGMLVDNSIVIMDGILKDKQKGLRAKEYLFRIGKQTAMPLLGATIIAAATLLCIYLSQGVVSEYAKDLFIVLLVSLMASWVLALVQVPICAMSWGIVTRKDKGKDKEGSDFVSRVFRSIITWLIGHKVSGVVIAVMMLVISVIGMSGIRQVFFPDFDYSQFIIEYSLPAGTSTAQVQADLLAVSEELSQNPEVRRTAVSLGSAPGRYSLVRPMTNGGESYGEIIVDCDDYSAVCRVIEQMRPVLRAEYPDAYIRMRKYNFSISTSHPVEVEFSGPDPAVLRQLSAQAQDVMRRCPLVDSYSVQDNFHNMRPVLTAQYSQADAMRGGLGRSDVANAMLAATDGMTVEVMNDDNKQLLIKLKVKSESKDLTALPVWSTLNVNIDNEAIQGLMSGATTMNDISESMFASRPLSSTVSDISLGWEDDYVYRVNGMRCVEAQCDPDPTNPDATADKVVSAIQEEIEAIPLPDGYKLRWVGEGELKGDAIGGLISYLPLTILIILFILLLLFNSWRQVSLVLLCLPFVLVGIVPSFLLTGQPFTFMAMLALFGLMGMMVKNTIVLLDEINYLKKTGMDSYHAVVEATLLRVRPVLMASLTTIFGMIPLLTDPMYSSMAVCIMGGLLMGTLITLVILPLFYSFFYRIRKV